MNWASERALNEIADHYGLTEQLGILQEECAELIQAVSKFRRHGYKGTESLAEEIADVEIMVTQIKYLAGLSESVEKEIANKIGRQKKRIIEESAVDKS